MKLTSQTALAELRELFAAANDDVGNHVLWVDTSGTVHLTMTGDSASLAGADEGSPVRLRVTPFEKGDGMVGADAALDTELIGDMYAALLHHWILAGDVAPGEIHIDLDDPDAGAGWTATDIAVVDDALLSKLREQQAS